MPFKGTEGRRKASAGGKLLQTFMNTHKSVRFHASVGDMAHVKPGEAKVALIAGRSQYNPRLLREVIDKVIKDLLSI